MPPAKIVIEPMERSLPVFGADYRSERIASFRKELDVPEDAAAPLDKIAKVRAEQLADLDAQEAMLRAKYDMPTPFAPGGKAASIAAARIAQGLPPMEDARADLARPGGDFSPADKMPPPTHTHDKYGNRTMPVPPIADAPQQIPTGRYGLPDPAAVAPLRATPPPSALAPVSEGTKDELRAVADQLIGAGLEPYPDGTPSSEADAQQTLKANRARLYDAKQKAARPPVQHAQPPVVQAAAQQMPAAVTTWKTPEGVDFTPGHRLPGGQRTCTDAEHGVRNPQRIDSKAYDDSMRLVGRALCTAHLAKARKGAK